MRLLGPDGEVWVSVDDAARQVRVCPGTIKVWKARGKVRGHRAGRHSVVALADVIRAERQWRQRATRRGRPRSTSQESEV